MSNKKLGDLNIASVIAILESETSSHEDIADAYSQVSKHMTGDDLSLYLYDFDVSKLVSLAVRDVLDKHPRVCQRALHVLGYCLHDKDHIKTLSNSVKTKCVVAIEKCLSQYMEDKDICTKALWCVGNQQINDFILQSEPGKRLIKTVIKVWNKWLGKATTIENEAGQSIIRLNDQDPDTIKECLNDFGKALLLSLVRMSPLTGSQVLTLAREVITRENLMLWSKTIVEEYKGSIGPELKKLMKDKHEVHALKLWSFYVYVLGKELHVGNFLNQMLPMVEEGFKSINAEVKIEAFRAWKQLIVNFSSDINVLSDLKRIKLIMQVFKFNNAKTEPVAMEKFKIWWFFIQKLGSKAAIYFEQVCIPLLNFCVGIKTATSNISNSRMHIGTSPVTPQHSILNSPASKLPVFPALQKYAWEILSYYFGEPPTDLPGKSVTYQLDSPKIEFLSGPPAFLKHSQWFIMIIFEIIKQENIADASKQMVWFALVAHIKNVLDGGIKSDVKDMFSDFLQQFQSFVLGQAMQLQSTKSPGEHLKNIWILFDAVCCLPRKALTSTGFNINNGENIHSTPALYLLESLLTPALLSRAHRSEKYLTMYGKLTSVGIETETGYLEFSQSVLELLNRNKEFVKEPDFLWRLWSRVANPLHDQINKTNEINQGDSLEHKFTCMYDVLAFPVQNKLAHLLEPPTYKTMLKTWTDMYSSFSRLSALVTTAETNICCEELCHVINGKHEDCFKNVNGLEFISQICLVVVNHVDFGSVGSVGSFNLGGFSPAKWAKKKQKPLENLQSMVELICRVSKILSDMTNDFMSTPQKSRSHMSKTDRSNFTSILTTIFETLSIIFTHITSSTFLQKLLKEILNPMKSLYKISTGWTGAHFNEMTEKLTRSICRCIQTHYNGEYDSEFLKVLSPFLEVTLSHPKQAVTSVVQTFWGATFGGGSTLEYPESFSEALQKMTKKHRQKIKLPGWTNSEIEVIEETPSSEFTQGESQAPEPKIPGMPSPHRIRGSFLNKAVSPNVKNSPAKAQEKGQNSAKKKILSSVDDCQNDVFVVIKSPPPKKTPLTEHQIEIFKEKRTVPAMYNTLDASQDVSLMAHFNSGNSQSQSQFQKILPAPPKSDPKVEKVGIQEKTIVTLDEKSELRIHGKWKKKKTDENKQVTRKRSVRFSDDTSPAQTSPDATTPKDIGHFSVIKSNLTETPPKSLEPSMSIDVDDMETSPSLIGREEGEIRCAEQLLSLGDTINKLSSQGESPDKDIQMSSPMKENFIPSPSQKKLDLWLIKSPSKQTGEVKSNKKDAESGTSTRKQRGKRLSGATTPRMTTRKSSTDRANKDKSSEESNKSTMEDSALDSLSLVEETQSPQEAKKSSENPVFTKPEVVSKVKVKQVSPVVSVVEETQSPTKTSGPRTDTLLSTPPRPGVKPLSFGNENIDHDEDSNVIPASPTSTKPTRVGTPILKLRKLTQDEILQYSPSRKEGTSSSLTPQRRRGRPRKNFTPCSSDPSSNRNSEKELADYFLHEHDDFSDLKPIKSDHSETQSNILTTSQGLLEIPANVQSSSLGFSNSQLEREFRSHGSQDNQSNGSNSSQGFLVQRSNSKDEEKPNSLSGSENLFTEQEPSSQEYNPCLESTLSDGPVKVIKTRRVSKSSDEGTKSDKGTDTGTESQEKTSEQGASNTPQKVQEESYNPMLESTLAITPLRSSARKRKQKTPKKLSPESTGPPKRKRRCLTNSATDENSSQDESGTDKRKMSDTALKNSRRKVIKASAEEISTSLEKSGVDKLSDECMMTNEESQALLSLEITGKSNPQSTDITIGHVQSSEVNVKVTCQIVETKLDDFMDIDFNESFSDKEIGKAQLDNVVKTPESVPVNKKALEKTPENRSISDTPTRVSTTKKKKEVAQKRSLSKGKASIPLDLDLNDDPSFSGEKSGGLDNIQETEQEHGIEETPMDEIQVEQSSEMIDEKEQTRDEKMNEDGSLTNNIAEEISNVKRTNEEGLTDERCEKSDENRTNGEDLTDVRSEKYDEKTSIENTGEDKNGEEKADEDINGGKIAEEKSKLNESSVSVSSDDNVPLSALKNGKDDDVPLKSLKNKKDVSPSLDMENQSDTQVIKKKRGRKKKGSNSPINVGKDTSPKSDEENLKGSSADTKKRGRKKIGVEGKLKTSPITQKLRSPGRNLRTRGMKDRRSTGDMLSLKSRNIKRRSLDETETQHQNETIALSEIIENTEVNDVIVIPSQSQEKTAEISTPKGSDEVVEDIAGPDNLKKFNDMMQDETPRKTPDVASFRKGLAFADRHSDSKLITVSRKFERRSMLARRSILKPNTRTSSLDSPLQQNRLKSFHPIKIGHVFSPAASPSAGILKRRRLSGEKATASPSPPSKHRRVSFAEPVSVSKKMGEQTDRPASPLVTQSSKVSASLEKIFTNSLNSESQMTDSITSTKESQVTQSSYASTQEDQLDNTHPVFPDLTSCCVTVDKVLPQLTSSMWSRGLGTLIKARNIHTIGDLSALTEKEVDELPIRSPKVSVVRKALKKFGEQSVPKQSKTADSSKNKDQTTTDTTKTSSQSETKIQDKCQEIKEIVSDEKCEENVPSHCDSITNLEEPNCVELDKDSAESRIEINQENESTSNTQRVADSSSEISLDDKSAKFDLISTFQSLTEQCNAESMKNLNTQEIFKIQQQLSALTGTVMETLKERFDSS